MTQDEIIRMAREAGFSDHYIGGMKYELERFVALVAAHEREKLKVVFEELEREVKTELINAINAAVELEREACAKVCDDYAAELDQNKSYWDAAAMNCAAAIRARSQHE